MVRFPKITLHSLRTIIIGLSLVAIGTGIGYRLGENKTTISYSTQRKQVIVNTSPPPVRSVDFALFWDVWSRLEHSYVDKTALDNQKMVWGAISGMVNALGDPYTLFLPPKENKEFKDDLGGSLEGIGAQLGMKDSRILVIAPLRGTPAQKAGIRAGDYILKVNDEDTNGWSVPQAVTKIRGPKGTTVKLTVFHEGADEETEITITRDTITVPSVEMDIKTASGSATRIAHLKIIRFGDQTNKQWDDAVKQIVADKSIKGIALDLRNNPGGYLQSAIYIASEFIKSGIVVQQENSDSSRETYSVVRAGKLLDIPLIVLINKGSASASEILAGALRDHDRGKLLGETSFGKGSIQTPEELPGGAGLHITTAKWLLPKGDWINSKGVAPTIEVKNDRSKPDDDLQLQRALQELVQ